MVRIHIFSFFFFYFIFFIFFCLLIPSPFLPSSRSQLKHPTPCTAFYSEKAIGLISPFPCLASEESKNPWFWVLIFLRRAYIYIYISELAPILIYSLYSHCYFHRCNDSIRHVGIERISSGYRFGQKDFVFSKDFVQHVQSGQPQLGFESGRHKRNNSEK